MVRRDEKYKVTLRLPPELAARLKRIAERNKRSLNSEVEFVLEEHARYEAERHDQEEEKKA